MTKKLSLIEEIECREKIYTPFLTYVGNSIIERKKIARDILTRKSEDVLLVDKWGFNIDSIFAGLSESHIEYFSKHAPREYKKSLMEIFQDKEMMDGVWEIVKSIDEDEGDGLMQNQKRIKNVIQYIRDNQIAFIN